MRIYYVPSGNIAAIVLDRDVSLTNADEHAERTTTFIEVAEAENSLRVVDILRHGLEARNIQKYYVDVDTAALMENSLWQSEI
jgi:hypothetical protein